MNFEGRYEVYGLSSVLTFLFVGIGIVEKSQTLILIGVLLLILSSGYLVWGGHYD